ncbi:integrase, catalytic region, zinc finger, CCHC-type containing protein [Tanacetum coccineum]
MIKLDPNQEKRIETEDDLTGENLKQYEAEIEAMNLILISVPNDIYNSVDSHQTANEIWLRVKRLMQGTELSKVDKETQFNNEFDRFITEPGKSLVSLYNRFSQLMNDLKRNNIKLPAVTINTKFLNCLQPEWIKYVTNIRLVQDFTKDPYDDLFDHLQQYEKIVIASRAKKLAKTHDPLALIAHTSSSSSRPPPAYYVTHPSSMVDYDDDYQGDTLQDDPEDPLTSAMMLLARAITQNVGNDGRIARRSYNIQEESAEGSNVQKETGNVQRTLQTSSAKNVTNVQCYNCSEKGHYACNCPNPRVRDSKYFMEQMLLAKKDKVGVSLSNEHNDFLVADAAQMEEIKELSSNICMMVKIQLTNIDSDDGPSYDSTFIKVNIGSIAHDKNDRDSHDNELEQLARNAYKEAEKQQILAQKVKQQNVELTKQLE